MKLIPLQDWAVIKPSPAEDVSAGGLYLPDTAKEKPAQGVVEAIGPGALEEELYGKKKKDPKDRKFIKTTVKPEDYVLYEQYAGQTYKVGDEDRVLVRERNILGMLPGGAPKANPAPKPLQIPAATSASRNTAIAPAGTRAIAKPGKKELATLSSSPFRKPAQPEKKAVKKVVTKATKKKAAAPARKAAKKAVPAKKKAVKKIVKKAAKKAKPAATKSKAGKSAKKKR